MVAGGGGWWWLVVLAGGGGGAAAAVVWLSLFCGFLNTLNKRCCCAQHTLFILLGDVDRVLFLDFLTLWIALAQNVLIFLFPHMLLPAIVLNSTSDNL